MFKRSIAAAAFVLCVGHARHLCGQTAPDPVCAKVTTDADAANHVTMDHSKTHAALARCAGPLTTLPGQAAFGAISEVVRMLQADPSTNWSRVNVEALRQHLIDMDEVTMHAAVVQRNVTGSAEIDAACAKVGLDADAANDLTPDHNLSALSALVHIRRCVLPAPKLVALVRKGRDRVEPAMHMMSGVLGR